jgi:hypothetical protein
VDGLPVKPQEVTAISPARNDDNSLILSRSFVAAASVSSSNTS